MYASGRNDAAGFVLPSTSTGGRGVSLFEQPEGGAPAECLREAQSRAG